ncbi:uncharacterized protein RAG0_05052 [Rhynchosporium agropyri]|uniref:Uncharacterized protein n=1 Tax=Rhynchosporium agropyri TaxID=914238 RepID=A0A1E1KBF3_9HELO|nr:uncharacterized protein RAG0_05052 [Rhynchosporium agropyri]
MSNWLPSGTKGDDVWRLDIVSLLAVVGESSIQEHSQALTASWTCILPGIIPAPQVLLKSSRPTRMPCLNTTVVGVHNGTLVPTLNFSPNIMHPIEDLQPFVFKLLQITHRWERAPTLSLHAGQIRVKTQSKSDLVSTSASVEKGMIENGPPTHSSTQQNWKFPLDGIRGIIGKCEFVMQAAIGLSYIIFTGLSWAASLVPKDLFWDLSNYKCRDITPSDAQDANQPQDETLEGRPSFTRTVWYAIRETKKTGWITRGGVAPNTDQ